MTTVDHAYCSKNLFNPPIRVRHADLTPASSQGLYRRICPVCGFGLLLVRRDASPPFDLQTIDYCTHCAQTFLYTDLEQIGFESLARSCSEKRQLRPSSPLCERLIRFTSCCDNLEWILGVAWKMVCEYESADDAVSQMSVILCTMSAVASASVDLYRVVGSLTAEGSDLDEERKVAIIKVEGSLTRPALKLVGAFATAEQLGLSKEDENAFPLWSIQLLRELNCRAKLIPTQPPINVPPLPAWFQEYCQRPASAR